MAVLSIVHPGGVEQRNGLYIPRRLLDIYGYSAWKPDFSLLYSPREYEKIPYTLRKERNGERRTNDPDGAGMEVNTGGIIGGIMGMRCIR